jgi:hypothetical protein
MNFFGETCKEEGTHDEMFNDLYTRNDDKSITRLNQPTNGSNGQYLKSNGDGSVQWDTPTTNTVYPHHLHNGFQVFNGVYGGSTEGFFKGEDKSFVCLKNGNSRFITGQVTVGINNVIGSIFVLSFIIPNGESRIGDCYGTAIGYSSNNAYLFNAISTGGVDAPNNRISMALQTVNRQNWTSNSILTVDVMYNITYFVPE